MIASSLSTPFSPARILAGATPARPAPTAASRDLLTLSSAPAPAPTPAPPAPAAGLNVGRIVKWSAACAAYGALVGAGTAMTYAAAGMGAGTAIHMTAILGGGALGAGVFGTALKPAVEAPMCYALGSLGGAGLTWATSAFGLMQNPVLGAVMGGVLGAFYGGLAAAIAPADKATP